MLPFQLFVIIFLIPFACLEPIEEPACTITGNCESYALSVQDSGYKEKIRILFHRQRVNFYHYAMEQWYGDRVKDFVSRIPPLDGNERTLDVGCGTGFVLKEIHELYPENKNLYGIDLSSEMINNSFKQGLNDLARFEEMDALNLRFDNESFDVVTARLTADYFPDKKKGVEEMMRVLKPGGYLILQSIIVEPSTAEIQNSILRSRDPALDELLTLDRWKEIISPTHEYFDSYEEDFDRWVTLTRAIGPDTIAQIQKDFTMDLYDNVHTNLNPVYRTHIHEPSKESYQKLYFEIEYVTFVLQKESPNHKIEL